MENKMISYIKSASIGILIIAIYFILANIELLPFNILNIDTKTLPDYIKFFYLIIYEIFTMIIIGIIMFKKLKKDFRDILINHKKYYSENFKFWLIGLAVMGISNCIIVFILKNDLSNNEELLRQLFSLSPIYVYITSIIFAPFVEEIVFRQGIRNIIKNKYLFILISGLLFGGLHVVTSMSSTMDLLYLIPYCSLGFVFAYMLYKTNNIFTSMGFHFLHNGLLISIQFIILIFS